MLVESTGLGRIYFTLTIATSVSIRTDSYIFAINVYPVKIGNFIFNAVKNWLNLVPTFSIFLLHLFVPSPVPHCASLHESKYIPVRG